jgi:hypothetical protein
MGIDGRGAADECESTHRGAARSGVFRDVGGDWDANQRIAGPQTSANRRIAEPQTGGNRRGSAPQTGGNRRIAAPRAAGCFGTLRFWTAPTPIRSLMAPRNPHRAPWWHHESPSCALAAPRILDVRRGGTTNPLRGARWSRGRPESPARPSRHLNRLWRCRPARPPTPRNTPLRAAPRCADSRPVDPTSTADSRPVDPTPTADSHLSAAPRRADPHPAPRADPHPDA